MAITIPGSVAPASGFIPTTTSYVFTTASTLGHTPAVGNLVVIGFIFNASHGGTPPSGHADWIHDRGGAGTNGQVDVFSRIIDGTEQATYTWTYSSDTVAVPIWEISPGSSRAWARDTGALNTSTATGTAPSTWAVGPTATLADPSSIGILLVTMHTAGGATTESGWTNLGTNNNFISASLITGSTTALSATGATSGSWNFSNGLIQTYNLVPVVTKSVQAIWNTGGTVTKAVQALWNTGGTVSKTVTGLWKVHGPVGLFKWRTEAAWTTDPLTRPSSWSDLASVVDGVHSLLIKRGAKVRSYALDTGTATVVADNANRVLDSDNAASPLYPNVQPRKRLHHIVTVGGTDVVLHTGSIERITIDWAQKSGSATLPTQDVFGLLANAILPPSVIDIVYRSLGPVALWPMSEVNGVQADDVLGTLDGVYAYPIQTFGDLVPFDSRKAPKFGRPTGTNNVSNNMVVYPFVANPAVSASIWFKWDVTTLVPSLLRRETVFMLQDSTSPVTFSSSSGIKSVFFFPGLNDSTGEQKVGLVIRDGSGFNQIDSPISPWTLNIYDGQAHHLAFSIDGATKTRIVWVDGVRQTMHDNPDGSVSPISSIDVAGVLAAVRLAAAGWGVVWNTASPNADSAAVGNAAYFDRMLSDAEVLSIYNAGVNPWDGDTIGARANKILDQIGVDPADRNINTGTQVCGPTNLKSQNALGYWRKIVATEGTVSYVSGDGKVTLPARNDSPAFKQVFSDRPDIDGGVPIAAVKPTKALDRIINTIVVGRENDADQIVTNPASVAAYGPLSGATGGRVDTLHRTAADARATGQRLVDRYGTPQNYIQSVTISATDRMVSSDALLLEVGDAVEVFQRPTGGGSPIHQAYLIEAIEHSFPTSLEWYVTYSLVEFVPDGGTFGWDVPSFGWDQGTW